MDQPDDKDNERFRELLPREIAKVAIEYIAERAGAEVALGADLDGIRGYAATGVPAIDVSVECFAPSMRWLPRTRRLQALGSDAGDRERARAYFRSFAGQAPDDDWEPPSDVARLTALYHEVAFVREGARTSLAVTLFGWLLFTIQLPTDLPLPWGSYDRRDFLPKRIFRGWA
jgi:hypothetical protein